MAGGAGTYGSDYQCVMSFTPGNQRVGGGRLGPRPWSHLLAHAFHPVATETINLTQVGTTAPPPPQELQMLLVLVLFFKTPPAALL